MAAQTNLSHTGEHSRGSVSSAYGVRQRIRKGEIKGHTSGIAGRHVQGNVVILPKKEAAEFLQFCQRNPKPCPLLDVLDCGAFQLPNLGQDIDIRSDVPAYRVWRDGILVEECNDIRSIWRDDLVTFILGCSFSFEQALIDDGIPLRHVQQGRNVAMFKTDIPTNPAGSFFGPLVVSMRPMLAEHVIRAIQITSRFPTVHGAPIHIGDPKLIGIHDLTTPEYGDAVDIMPNEIPVFWACGVTPQAAILQAKPPLCITHAPGCMLVTDLLNHHLSII